MIELQTTDMGRINIMSYLLVYLIDDDHENYTTSKEMRSLYSARDSNNPIVLTDHAFMTIFNPYINNISHQ